MATGPLIRVVAAGAALSVTPINENFAAIRDFLGSLPVDNLNAYRANHVIHGYTEAVVSGATRYFGYTRFEGGTFAAEPTQLVVMMRRAVVIAANTVIVRVQKTSTDITGATASAAVWTTIGTITFNATNTAAAYRNEFVAAGDGAYVQSVAIAGQTLEDAYGVRFEAVDGGTGANSVELWASLTNKLRLRG